MRTWLTPDRLQEAHDDLAAAVASLAEAIALMQSNSVPFLLLHGEDQISTKSKTTKKWATGVLEDVKADLPDFTKGVATKAERQVFQQRGEIPPRPDVPTTGKPKKAKKG